MVLAGMIGGLLTLVAVHQAGGRVQVVVAARSLHAGAVLEHEDVRVVRIAADGGVLDTLAAPGTIATRPVLAIDLGPGELIPRRALLRAAAPNGQRAMSIPIDPARAVNGNLVPGDRIDVLVATETEIVIVLTDVTVLDVTPPRSGGLGDNRRFAVTVAVDARGSQLLAAAIADGDVLLARTTGAASSGGLGPLPFGTPGALAGQAAR